MNSLHTKEG